MPAKPSSGKKPSKTTYPRETCQSCHRELAVFGQGNSRAFRPHTDWSGLDCHGKPTGAPIRAARIANVAAPSPAPVPSGAGTPSDAATRAARALDDFNASPFTTIDADELEMARIIDRETNLPALLGVCRMATGALEALDSHNPLHQRLAATNLRAALAGCGDRSGR